MKRVLMLTLVSCYIISLQSSTPDYSRAALAGACATGFVFKALKKVGKLGYCLRDMKELKNKPIMFDEDKKAMKSNFIKGSELSRDLILESYAIYVLGKYMYYSLYDSPVRSLPSNSSYESLVNNIVLSAFSLCTAGVCRLFENKEMQREEYKEKKEEALSFVGLVNKPVARAARYSSYVLSAFFFVAAFLDFNELMYAKSIQSSWE